MTVSPLLGSDGAHVVVFDVAALINALVMVSRLGWLWFIQIGKVMMCWSFGKEPFFVTMRTPQTDCSIFGKPNPRKITLVPFVDGRNRGTT